MFKYNYNNIKEKKLVSKFESDGYVIFDVGNQRKKLKAIKNFVIKDIYKLLKSQKIVVSKKEKNLLDNLHKYLPSSKLNNIRLKIYNNLNKQKWFLKNYFEVAKDQIETICGNELAMQRKVNLSIQYPNDDSSLLPVHSDVWSGCSPYEIVLWIPLVDVSRTKSMFILNKKENFFIYKNFHKYENSKKLQKKIDNNIKWLNIKYGQALIFTHQLLHGNKVNKSKETRWSFNCRFKSLMSPYDKKGIAETFLPISIRPATKFGIKYEDPKIK